ncbi:MAG TPA: tetratricopeptide repeat protein [Bryobacteraceae bacterium]|nr:tetratricopeptide repeat protein [Bryobacteraceae bacterium]
MMKYRQPLLLLPVVLLLVSCSQDPKAQAQRYLSNGNKFYDKGKYKEASIMYRRALQKDLKYGEAYYRLGLADIKLMAFGDAARALRRAVDLQPENVDAGTKLAEIFIIASGQDATHAGDLRMEARELALKMLQGNPNSYNGHRLMGQLALLDKDAPKAVEELSTAYKIDNKTDLSLALFQALVQDGKAAEAEKLAGEVLDRDKTYGPMYDLLYVQYVRTNRLSEGEQLLKRKTESNPAQPNFVLQLLSHYYFAKRFDDMDGVLRQLTDEKRFPEGHLLAGDFFFFRAREYDRARIQYQAGAKSQPRDKAAYQKRLVELMATMGQNQDASRLLDSLLAENPKDSDAIAMRAALMLQTGNAGQIRQAANDLQSLVAKTPENHLLHYNLARAYVAQGDAEQARLQLEAAIKIRPDFIVARDLLARIYMAKNDPARALKEADEIIALDANDLQARLIRSSALIGIGDREKAHLELDAVSKLAPDNPDARYQSGFMAWQSKDYKEAEQTFAALYKSNPRDMRGLVGVVETLAGQNKMPEAIKVMQEASDKEPERRDMKLALANLFVRDLRYDDAIRIYNTLVQSDPKSSDLLFRLAETQRRKGDVNTAIETFRRASQAAPTDPRPLLQLGLLMDGTGRREQAKPIYEQILKLQPDHPIALNNLAFIKAEEGTDLDEALTMAQRARQKLPGSPNIKDTLGWIYIKKNLSDDAVRIFRELVDQEPGNPSFHYHYGLALLQKGDRPSAKREFAVAIRDNPSKDEAGKLRELLAAN